MREGHAEDAVVEEARRAIVVDDHAETAFVFADEVAERAELAWFDRLRVLDLDADQPEIALDDQVHFGPGRCAVEVVVEDDAEAVQLADDLLDDHSLPGPADLGMAERIVLNAKCQRPGVCNAMETLLVHKDIADKFLPPMCSDYNKAGVEVRGCPLTKKIVPQVVDATEEDWSMEYLSLIVSIKTVASIEEAINHINKHGSGHSEAIVTNNQAAADEFLRDVDAAAVLHNASTRMHDGGVFGLGAEIGTSTQKLHARGTMGVRELTTTKYIVHGTGQIRQ